MFKKISQLILIAIFTLSPLLQTKNAMAASLTSLSDTMSSLKASTAANHEIKFVTPTGVAAAGTITLAFSADFTGVSSIAFGDIDFAEGDSSNCSTANFTEKTLAGSPSGTTWGAAAASQTITLTSGTGTVTAGRCVRFKIGTNAVTGTTGTNRISNGAADDDDTITIAGTFGDTGTITVDIITDDQVAVTATVTQSITFAIVSANNIISFGTLSDGEARYATEDDQAGSSDYTEVPHTLTIGTNAKEGYTISYSGATLTSGSNTIDVATITGEITGTPGTEQFAISISASGDASVDPDYDFSGLNWSFVAGSTYKPVVSETGPTATETFSMHYIANIAALTQAGVYSTSITYNATANF